MKMGPCKATTLTVLLICAFMAMMSGSRFDPATDGSDGSFGWRCRPPWVHGHLEQVYDGRMIGFGPFVGYYFRPEDPHCVYKCRAGILPGSSNSTKGQKGTIEWHIFEPTRNR